MNKKERNDLDIKLKKIGYEHPKEIISNRESQYMGYSEKSEKDYFSQKFDTYATFNCENQEKEEKNLNYCDKCNKKAKYSCNCPFRDVMCDNGHIWFIKNGKKIFNNPH